MKDLLKRIFINNWGFKLFSFLLALVLWLTMIPEQKIFTEKTLTVPLELHNIPSQMEVIQKPSATVDVTVRAPRRLSPQITQATVHAVLDLQNISVKQEDFPLSKNMISIPEGAEVKEVYPSRVRMRLEMTKEILLVVQPSFIGQVPEGYRLVKYDIIPPEVAVRGPESKMKGKHPLSTKSIDLSEKTRSEEIQADLISPSPDIRLAGTLTVTIRLVIEKEGPQEAGDDSPPSKKKPGRKPPSFP